jgi:hypothetical protein
VRRRFLLLLHVRTIVAFQCRVKVLIIKRPVGVVDGVDLKRYAPGVVYDVSAVIADYLVLNGFAVTELRSDTRNHPHERRKFPR